MIEDADPCDSELMSELDKFCVSAGLSMDEGIEGDVLVVKFIRDDVGLAATARLEVAGDIVFVEGVAVREDLRGSGHGREIVGAIMDEARAREFSTIRTVARTPGFFLAIGFSEETDAPIKEQLMRGCRSCEQYGRRCRPGVLRMDL